MFMGTSKNSMALLKTRQYEASSCEKPGLLIVNEDFEQRRQRSNGEFLEVPINQYTKQVPSNTPPPDGTCLLGDRAAVLVDAESVHSFLPSHTMQKRSA